MYNFKIGGYALYIKTGKLYYVVDVKDYEISIFSDSHYVPSWHAKSEFVPEEEL